MRNKALTIIFIILISTSVAFLILNQPILSLDGNLKNSHRVDSDSIEHDVPFTAQAPLGDWKDDRQNDGCEEAAAMMAMHWVKGTSFTPKEAEEEIIAIADYETEHFGLHNDTSAKDSMERILKGYYGYDKAELRYDININNLKEELAKGNVLLVPINGQMIGNQYYTPPGPPAHMILLIGYDENKQEFISHDPGTRHGKSYRYSYEVMQKSLSDYKTGNDEPVVREKHTAMVIVSK